VDPNAAQKILALNRQFYQTFAGPFSDTRMRLQPGVHRILERLQPSKSVLDLGCGNGYLASQLAQKNPGVTYIGLDNSPGLLERARTACGGLQNISFHLADLASPTWEAALAAAPEAHANRAFDAILAFAVLHHIPGTRARASLLRKIRSFIQPDGEFIHSEWQFLNNPRLRLRIQAWETIGLAECDVDPGDYLLDWRQGGQGLRYVHHFSEDELAELARESGFVISETFYADGEGGNLGLYQVWLPA
jgi:tRNA (uracil-5-)-methyltransferase TRM9